MVRKNFEGKTFLYFFKLQAIEKMIFFFFTKFRNILVSSSMQNPNVECTFSMSQPACISRCPSYSLR